MTKIHIKTSNLNELKSVIKTLELNNSPELNTEVTIELGESESLANTIQNNIRNVMEKRLI